ncbi:hypothetical protein NBRC111894_1191 [Sporolactobacillus inulinus]|uniref:Uncharacterized protein n=1 Tax=Sporolactobacillus inulinus TaxID=2078 RepID=A0A4Y1Z9A6_9BACL|nr:hypothetical protein NBRC111894_1191 [Sporolactobacillus inulinus]
MQSRIPHFHIFRVDKRNLSVYFKLFLFYFLIKGNFSVYITSAGCGDFRVVHE